MEKSYEIIYECSFKDKEEAYKFQVVLDTETLTRQKSRDPKNLNPYIPDWTHLEQNQCDNCPLSKAEFPHCPVALSLYEIIDNFSRCKSFEKVLLTIRSPDRNHFKETDLQSALQSLFGLVMASSLCPHFELFRPLNRFHLPFASMDETLIRVLSMHFAKSFAKARKNGESSFSFENAFNELKERYQMIETVNRGLLERIASVSRTDAQKNAFVGLNLFIQNFTYEFEANFDSIKDFFHIKSST